MASKDAIEKALAVLAHCIRDQPAAMLQEGGMEAAVTIWQDALPDLDDHGLEQAVRAYVRGTRPFWPIPGQILQAAPGRRVKAISDAGEAWGELLAMASGHGRQDPPGERWQLSDDPDRNRRLASGLKAVGGWRALCDSQTRDHTAHRAAFRTAYENQGQWMEAVREERVIEAAAGQVLKLEDKGGSNG